MGKYRVFVSYSHENQELVNSIIEVLESNGLNPMFDQKFSYGYGFPEQIRTFIAHSHVFLPVITEDIYKRGWVHQEIGYALAQNIPILPVVLDTLPNEMIRELHAIKITGKKRELKKQFPKEVFDSLVKSYDDMSIASFCCAELQEDRTIMMVKHAKEVRALGTSAYIRQKGALSSFHIPKESVNNKVWTERYGSLKNKKSDFLCKRLREERILFEQFARESGCRIIIDPTIKYERYGKNARISRLGTLLKYLKSIPNEKIQVVFNSRMGVEENLTLVGDWFAAESISTAQGKGYRQTIFTRHAPSMHTRIELFDNEFKELLQEKGWTASSSREKAISAIEEIYDEITR
jgi:hypothetical protein